MVEFHMLVGVAGSGKSTYGEKLSQMMAARLPLDTKVVILSSDAIREELWGDAADQQNPQKVFQIMNRRTVEFLKQKICVVYDATNLTGARRADLLRRLRQSVGEVMCEVHVVAAPEDECIRRQDCRDRKVPAAVIHHQICQFEMPQWGEGWDMIALVPTSSFLVEHYLQQVFDMPQDNSHHTLTLGQHCAAAQQQVAIAGDGKVDDALLLAARYHDVGKALTKSFVNAKGDITDDAHYYAHERVSAWLMACDAEAGGNAAKWIAAIQLVSLHMMPYFLGDRLHDWLDKKDIGKDIEWALDVLHKADLAAH